MMFFFCKRVVQGDDLYVYNMHNIVEIHFSISIESARKPKMSLIRYEVIYFRLNMGDKT
jgi:hypothetical protein